MLIDFVSPPYPPWSVDELRQWLQPWPAAPIDVAELQPQCAGYDALLNLNPEVTHVG